MSRREDTLPTDAALLASSNANEAPRTGDVPPLEPHPAALVFPLKERALQELADDIKAHGLREPIVTWTSPAGAKLLLDGRSRRVA